jgi:nucleotide-binding universal stress UspA family protein
MITQPVRLQSILVPLDGSELAEQAITIAQEITERARCKLKLVLVHDRVILMKPGKEYTRLELAMQKADRDYLKSVTARVRERLGRTVSSAVLQDLPVVETLARYIREAGADLVVMTTHGRGGLRRAWLGSVTDQLIRSAEVPVLVVRPDEAGAARPVPEWGEILVALDGSPLAEAALEPAIELAKLWDAELSLVQVVPPITTDTGPHLTFPSSYAEHATAMRRDAADDYIRDVAERVRESGVRSSGVAVIGSTVPETLIELADPERIGLLVLATHGLGGLRRMVLGSVADKMVRAARVPILVVRPTARRAQRKSGEVDVAIGAGAPSWV